MGLFCTVKHITFNPIIHETTFTLLVGLVLVSHACSHSRPAAG